jgi:hypothetical protein
MVQPCVTVKRLFVEDCLSQGFFSHSFVAERYHSCPIDAPESSKEGKCRLFEIVSSVVYPRRGFSAQMHSPV